MSKITFEEVYANSYIRKSVEVFVEKQIKSFPVLSSSRDDIAQELWIEISKAIEKFNPLTATIETFVRSVIEYRIHNIREHMLTDDASTSYFNSLEDIGEDLTAYAKDQIHLIDLKMDLETVMARLTPDQRKICEMLLAGYNISQIAQKVKMAESSIFHFYIYPIRTEFKKEKLEKYLENL